MREKKKKNQESRNRMAGSREPHPCSVRPRGDFYLRLYKFWGSWTFLFKHDFWLGHFLLQDIKPDNHTCPVITEAGEGPYQSPVPDTGQRNRSSINGCSPPPPPQSGWKRQAYPADWNQVPGLAVPQGSWVTSEAARSSYFLLTVGVAFDIRTLWRMREH